MIEFILVALLASVGNAIAFTFKAAVVATAVVVVVRKINKD
jgi:hypothetical protein